ncbi:unnamed protein product [Calicophoron daubneyi]|uniref:Uncharacterized protein n=1 Tax=Calicophoron daubneyi TaxID=300641 RepID=A0AAV2TEW8_CALDB
MKGPQEPLLFIVIPVEDILAHLVILSGIGHVYIKANRLFIVIAVEDILAHLVILNGIGLVYIKSPKPRSARFVDIGLKENVIYTFTCPTYIKVIGVRRESQGSNDQKNLAARNPRRLLLPRPGSTENQKKSETKNRNTPPVRLSVPAIFAFAAIPMVTIRMEDETGGQIGHAVDVPTNSPSRIPDNNEISQSGVRSTELSALPIGAALQAVLSNVFFAPNPETNSTFSSQSTKPAKCEDVAIRPDVDEPSVCRGEFEASHM